MSAYRTTSSPTVYENPWMRVREDGVVRPDGSSGIFGVVEKPDFALVVPRSEGGYHLVEQYRYPIGGRFLEFPQGSWEAGSRADPAVLARGELQEETGLVAGRMEHLGHLYEAYGYSTQGFDVFLATDLEQGLPRRDATEADMVVHHVPFDALPGLVAAGRVKDGPTLAALALLTLREPA